MEKKDSILRDRFYTQGYNDAIVGGQCLPSTDAEYKLRYVEDYVMGHEDGQGDTVSELNLTKKMAPTGEYLWAIHQLHGTEKWFFFENLADAISLKRDLNGR